MAEIKFASTEEFYAEINMLRGIEEPCKGCGGLGVRAYAGTSTWRGGAGGMTITSDVCDRCWGSGDADRKWPSHRMWAQLQEKK